MQSLKIIQIVGFILLMLGVIIRAGAGEYYGTVIAVVGVLIYATGKVGAWLKSANP